MITKEIQVEDEKVNILVPDYAREVWESVAPILNKFQELDDLNDRLAVCIEKDDNSRLDEIMIGMTGQLLRLKKEISKAVKSVNNYSLKAVEDV